MRKKHPTSHAVTTAINLTSIRRKQMDKEDFQMDKEDIQMIEDFLFSVPPTHAPIPYIPKPKPTEADLLKSLREKGMNFSEYAELESKVAEIYAKIEFNEPLTEDELALRQLDECGWVMDDIQKQIDDERPTIYIGGDVFTPSEFRALADACGLEEAELEAELEAEFEAGLELERRA